MKAEFRTAAALLPFVLSLHSSLFTLHSSPLTEIPMAKKAYRLLSYEQFLASAETDLSVPDDVTAYPTNNVQLMQAMYASYRQSGIHHGTFLYFTRNAYVQECRSLVGAELCEGSVRIGAAC